MFKPSEKQEAIKRMLRQCDCMVSSPSAETCKKLISTKMDSTRPFWQNLHMKSCERLRFAVHFNVWLMQNDSLQVCLNEQSIETKTSSEVVAACKLKPS